MGFSMYLIKIIEGRGQQKIMVKQENLNFESV